MLIHVKMKLTEIKLICNQRPILPSLLSQHHKTTTLNKTKLKH